jgi:hypothetical protein
VILWLMPLLSRDSLVDQRMTASFVIALHDGFVDGLVEVFKSGEGLVSHCLKENVTERVRCLT